MRIIVRRFFDLTLPMIGLSAIANFLMTKTFLPLTQDVLGIVMLFVALLFLLLNGFFLRCCFRAAYQTMDYYLDNLFAYILFAAALTAAYIVLDSNTYMWMFSLTMTFSVLFETVSDFGSFLIFNGIVILMTLSVPYFE
ncbi:MAG: hypothetical protein IJ285_06770 [Clostridia bacterium]|nr:hypothetical protein [Clostridia bacterium]